MVRTLVRTAHGTGRNAITRVEVPPIDELPAGVPSPADASTVAPAGPSTTVTKRRGAGKRFEAGDVRASEAGRKGAQATKERRAQLRVIEGLGLHGAPPAALAPYLADAQAFAESEALRLAQEVGGGVCPPQRSGAGRLGCARNGRVPLLVRTGQPGRRRPARQRR